MIAEQEAEPKLFHLREVMNAAIASGEVQIQNVTGKRREGPILPRAPAREDEGIPIIRATTLSTPEPARAPSAKDDRRPLDERLAALARAEAMLVAQTQPHRRGEGGDRRATSFGRFCEDYKPVRLGDHCYHAGERYAEIVREEKNARGLLVMGGAPREPGFQILTEEQMQARKDLAILRLKEANEILIRVMPRLPRAMERLTYDDLEPGVYDFGILRDGLVLLAKEFGLRGPRFGEAG